MHWSSKLVRVLLFICQVQFTKMLIDNMILQRGKIFLHVRTKITMMVNKILRCSTTQYPSQYYLHTSVYTYTFMAGCTYTVLLVHTETVFIILQQQKSTTHRKCFVQERALILT